MKRGHYKADAVILNTFDYGESDRIITFYTNEMGKLRGIAKGARRSRRRFVGNLEPLSRTRLLFYHNPKSELVRIEDSTLTDGFSRLRGDIERLTAGSYLVELTSEMTREGQTNPALFGLLAGFLKLLDGGESPVPLLRFFEIKLLQMVGFMPRLESCVVCNGTLKKSLTSFSSDKGGMVCKTCAPKTAALIPLSAGTAGFLAMAARLDIDKLTRLVPNPVFIEQGERLLDCFIRHQTGKELKTKRFIEKLRNGAPIPGKL
jgi:DNA repair protein RecO (recombination protein O)